MNSNRGWFVYVLTKTILSIIFSNKHFANNLNYQYRLFKCHNHCFNYYLII